jgi:hypothetical protein
MADAFVMSQEVARPQARPDGTAVVCALTYAAPSGIVQTVQFAASNCCTAGAGIRRLGGCQPRMLL